jgi:hypothetical protein
MEKSGGDLLALAERWSRKKAFPAPPIPLQMNCPTALIVNDADDKEEVHSPT